MNHAPVAIVTGAARGLGAAIAQRLAKDGMSVAAIDLDASTLLNTREAIETAGGRVATFAADVTDSGQVEDTVAAVTEQLGAPTVLINNAGIIRDNLLFKMTEDDWTAVMDVHLKGSFLMSRAVQQHMVQAGFGRIVNLSSTSALGNRGQANYSAAKAGLQGVTKTLALELGKFGVTVNCVAPGFIVSDMNRSVAERLGMSWEQYLASVVDRIPVGRAGQPEDVADMVAFFAGRTSGFVTGQVVYVAGGPKN